MRFTAIFVETWLLAFESYFSESPNLNTTFVECNPSNRVFATAETSDDKYWIQLYQDVKALRLMPKYGTPML